MHLRTKRLLIMNKKGGGQFEAVIQLVTPMQQAVERAKWEMKEMRKPRVRLEK